MPKKDKIYLLSRIEKKEVQEFIKDQLRKWYIKPSKCQRKMGKRGWYRIIGI